MHFFFLVFFLVLFDFCIFFGSGGIYSSIAEHSYVLGEFWLLGCWLSSWTLSWVVVFSISFVHLLHRNRQQLYTTLCPNYRKGHVEKKPLLVSLKEISYHSFFRKPTLHAGRPIVGGCRDCISTGRKFLKSQTFTVLEKHQQGEGCCTSSYRQLWHNTRQRCHWTEDMESQTPDWYNTLLLLLLLWTIYFYLFI